VDVAAERVQRLPALVGKGFGDARMLGDARHRHGEVELRVRLAEVAAADRGGVAVVRGGGERNVAFAGQKAGGWVEADPAGAGDIDLAPGMKVGEVDLGAGGAVERLEVGRQ